MLLVVGMDTSVVVTRDLDSTRQMSEIVLEAPSFGVDGFSLHCSIKVSSHNRFPFDVCIIADPATIATTTKDIFPILGDIFTLFSLVIGLFQELSLFSLFPRFFS